jgi:hypothetical protein
MREREMRRGCRGIEGRGDTLGFGGLVVVDGDKAADEEAADVGEDGGAAG